MRIWIAGGGTGGHVYPGLAVVQALADKVGDALDVLYVGGEDGVEQHLATRAGLQFAAIPAGGVHGLAARQAVQNMTKLIRGWRSAYRLGRRDRPAAMFATGGYASVPVAFAAWMLRVPILVYLPDIEPGLAVRVIARMADRVAVTIGDSRVYLPDRKVVVTGYPVRDDFRALDRSSSRSALGLPPDRAVLLVMGGSRGARSINRALGCILEQVLTLTEVVHISGELDWPWVSEQREALPDALRERYHAYPYLHEKMGAALAAADLAVCRAGASTLGELPFFGLPAILVPYPHAWRYQRINADWLAGRGAAVRLNDEDMNTLLLPTLQRLFRDRPTLATMAGRMQSLAHPDAASCLADQLLALVHQ